MLLDVFCTRLIAKLSWSCSSNFMKSSLHSLPSVLSVSWGLTLTFETPFCSKSKLEHVMHNFLHAVCLQLCVQQRKRLVEVGKEGEREITTNSNNYIWNKIHETLTITNIGIRGEILFARSDKGF